MRSLHKASDDIREGRATPRDLVEECLERINRLDPHLRAWVFTDPAQARAEADRLGEELQRGRSRGPLHGIPIGVKDIFDVFDWPTAAGSKRWEHAYARQDASVVRHLRQAGAIFLGKTVTTAYACFDVPPTRNPWNPARTPGGSSSGSAAAVATGMCLGALASQTGGSITRPAAYCGVAGLKPTFGRVSCHGVVPLAASMDHPGVIAPTVRDLAILLQAIAGYDPADPCSVAEPVPDFQVWLTDPLPTPRLARVRGHFEESALPTVRAMMDMSEEAFRAAGAVVVPRALPGSFAGVIGRHRTVIGVEAAAFHAERLKRHPDDYPSRITELVREGTTTPAHEYARCKEHQRSLARELMACFDGVDVLLTPASPGPAPGAETTGDPSFNAPWSYVGFPTVTFRAGMTPDGLPLGLQVVGKPWGEADLLGAAAWCEQVLKVEPAEPPLGG